MFQKENFLRYIFSYLAYLVSAKAVNGRRQNFNFGRLICEYFYYVVFTP